MSNFQDPDEAAPRLLFIVNNPAFFLSHRVNIARTAADKGWSVHVATPPGETSESITAEGFTWHAIPMTRSGANPLSELKTIRAIYRLLKALSPDIVHTVTIKPVLYTGLVAPWAKVPALVHAISGLGTIFLADGFRDRLRRQATLRLYRLALRHSNSKVIVQNTDDARLLSTALRPDQAVLLPGSGVDPADFPPQPEPKGLPIVVLPARMITTKGIVEFAEAARILRAEGLRARFALVGNTDPGNPNSLTSAQLESWARRGFLEWWGHRPDMAAVYASAAIVCQPTFYREGVPKVLLEAAASQRPVITTDVPGCRDVVDDGESGIVVPPRDPVALATAIRKLLENPELRTNLATAARERFLRGFTSSDIVAGTLELYENLSSGVGRHPNQRRTHA